MASLREVVFYSRNKWQHYDGGQSVKAIESFNLFAEVTYTCKKLWLNWFQDIANDDESHSEKRRTSQDAATEL